MLASATKNLPTVLFTNPQRLKSEECGDHAVGPARQLRLSMNTTWGLVNMRVRKCGKERHVIEKNHGTLFVIL